MNYVSINPGTYQAPSTDGFALGIVNGTSAPGFAWITGSCGPATAVASGGLFGYSTAGGTIAVGNSFLLPVPAGQTFSLAANILSGQPATPTIQFFYVGTGNPTAA